MCRGRPKSSPNDSGRVPAIIFTFPAIIFITLFFVCRAIPVLTKQYDTYVMTRALGGSCIICPLSSIMEFTNDGGFVEPVERIGFCLKVNISDESHWPVFSYLAVHIACLLCNMMSHQSRGKGLKSCRTYLIVLG